MNHNGLPSGPLKILIARLTPEKTVSLSFSHRFIFDLLDSKFRDRLLLDYFFFPARRRFEAIKNAGFRGAVSFEKQLPISDFDIIAVSNSFQLELINLYHLISMLHAPFRLKDRIADENSPLIIAGGVNTPSIACVCGSHKYAPSSLFDDGSSSAIDAIFIGEAERNLIPFIDLILHNPSWKKSKSAIIEKALNNIDGIYYPVKYIHEFEYVVSSAAVERRLKKISPAGNPETELNPVRSVYVSELDSAHKFKGLIYSDSLIRATAPVEISRGCASMCSFCKEGYTQKPYREKSAAAAAEQCYNLSSATGFLRFNLYSYNFNDHSAVHDIIEALSARGLEAEVKSQRVDMAVKMPRLLSYLQASGSASPTFAIEGISDRIRSRLSKNLNSLIIYKFIENVFINKPRQVKLFFIITGLENDKDFLEFDELCARLIKNRKLYSPGASVIFSFMPLVLCQKTPLMFSPAPDSKKVYDIIFALIKKLNGFDKITARISIDKKAYDITSICESGGRELSCVLYDLAVNYSAVYYDDIDDKTYNRFITGVKKAGFSFSEFRAEKNISSVFNSDDRNYGVDKSFLYKAWLNAKKFKDMPRCIDSCSGCGACGDNRFVYKTADPVKKDSEFALKISSYKRPALHKIIVPADIENSDAPPHREIYKKLNGAAFNIIDDSFSKLNLNNEKFYGKNYYLLDSTVDIQPDIKLMPFDRINECNYIFAAVDIKNDSPGGAIRLNNSTGADLFKRFNPKFKMAVHKINNSAVFKGIPELPSGEKYIIYTNADSFKKRPAAPLIIFDEFHKKLYALFKIDVDFQCVFKKVKIIEYIKFYEYNVKDKLSYCALCGRTMSVPIFFEAGRPAPENCFICDIFNSKHLY